MPTEIRFTKSGVAGIGRRELQEVGRAAILATGMHWWRKFLPIHFTKAATKRYQYKPRSGEPGSGRAFRGSYSEAKQRRTTNGQGSKTIGEVKPFVWSGTMREQLTSRPNMKEVAENFRTYRVDIFLNAPALNLIPGGRDEMTRITPAEFKELDGVFEAEYESQLNKRGRTARKVRRIVA